MCEAEHDTVAPAASEAAGSDGVQEPIVACGSVRATFVSGDDPALVTTIEYVSTSPTALNDAVDVVFTTRSALYGVVALPERVTATPPGAVPDAVATFVYGDPRSPATTVWLAEQTIVDPGTSSPVGSGGEHEPSWAFGSLTVTFERGAVPELVTTIVYVMTSPAAENDDVPAVLVTSSRPSSVVSVDCADTVAPAGVPPDAVAVLTMFPPATSAAVAVWLAGQVIEAPAASDAAGTVGEHEPSVAFGSVTVTFVSGAVPVFVVTIE